MHGVSHMCMHGPSLLHDHITQSIAKCVVFFFQDKGHAGDIIWVSQWHLNCCCYYYYKIGTAGQLTMSSLDFLSTAMLHNVYYGKGRFKLKAKLTVEHVT